MQVIIMFSLISPVIILSFDFATRALCSQRSFLSMRVIAWICPLNRSGGSKPKLALLEYQAPKWPHCMLLRHNANRQSQCRVCVCVNVPIVGCV